MRQSSTLIVIAVKFIVSPHSPVTAHFAVLIQGIAGYVIYSLFGCSKFSTALHGSFALVYSAFQKLITATILFGMDFWRSFDHFISSTILPLFSIRESESSSALLLIVILYLLIYLIVGIFTGLFASSVPHLVEGKKEEVLGKFRLLKSTKDPDKFDSRKLKTRLILFLVLIIAAALTYAIPLLSKESTQWIIMLLIRTVAILIVWLYILSPLLKYLLRSRVLLLVRREEIENVISRFGKIKSYTLFSLRYSLQNKVYLRIQTFILTLIILVLYEGEPG